METLGWARASSLEVLVLGGGSNLVVADAGFDGLVLRARNDDVRYEAREGGVRVIAGGGASWEAVVLGSVARGLSGLECLAGIPGDVGATPIQNVGAYGQEVGDTLVEVQTFDRATLTPRTFDRPACKLGYRDSVFKHEEKDRHVVWSVTLDLSSAPPAAPTYAELRDHLAGGDAPLTAARVSEAVVTLRRRKSMVLDAADPDARSAGSFFVNPVLSAEEFARFAASEAVCALASPPPVFRQTDGMVKVPAAWLIERAGFPRGTRGEGVGLSSKHALAIVNHGAARASQVVAFATQIRSRVRDAFGLALTPEPQFVGFDPEELAPLFD